MGLQIRQVVILSGENNEGRKAQVCLENNDQDRLTEAGCLMKQREV